MTSESPPPICSVCIANYNGIKVIDACIRSVMSQNPEQTIEIIIHDDASTDGSAEYIRSRYPDIELIVSETNVGFCVSNNRMVNVARGHYILLLNNDAELFPDALHTLYVEAERLGKPAILGLPQYDAATGVLIDIGSHLDLFLNSIPNLNSSQPTEIASVIGACFWLPKNLWDELGGFPAWFGSLAEDTYLCLLARLYGYQVIALPISGFRHWVGQSLGGGKLVNNRLSSKLSRRASSERNKTFSMVLTFPSPIIQMLLPAHLILLLVEGLIIAGVKLRWAIFHDIYWNCLTAQFNYLHQLRQARTAIQTKKKIKAAAFFRIFHKFPHKISLLWKHGFPQIR